MKRQLLVKVTQEIYDVRNRITKELKSLPNGQKMRKSYIDTLAMMMSEVVCLDDSLVDMHNTFESDKVIAFDVDEEIIDKAKSIKDYEGISISTQYSLGIVELNKLDMDRIIDIIYSTIIKKEEVEVCANTTSNDENDQVYIGSTNLIIISDMKEATKLVASSDYIIHGVYIET
jgi:hypothetical protein